MRETYDFVLIDDNNLDNLINETLVRNSGVGSSVVVFNSVLRALDYFKRIPLHRKKVILLDHHMPDMDGTEFLEKLKSSLGDKLDYYKVVFLSNDSTFVANKRRSSFIRDAWKKPLRISYLENLSAVN